MAATAASSAESLSDLETTVLDALLLQASDIASNYCNIQSVAAAAPTFARQSIVEQIIIPAEPNQPRVKSLFTSLSPVDITAVTINAVAVDLADLFIDPIGILSFLPTASRRYWDTEVIIELTMSAGYVSPVQKAENTPPAGPDLPTDIVRAVILIAQQLNGSESREEFGLISETDTHDDLGTLSKRWSDASKTGGIPAEASSYLDPHRRLF